MLSGSLLKDSRTEDRVLNAEVGMRKLERIRTEAEVRRQRTDLGMRKSERQRAEAEVRG